MHHPDTDTHAHMHTHQNQWAVKCCPYPPQTASTNQIRPDQNMPFKARAWGLGKGAGVVGVQGSAADVLTLGAISMTRKSERRRLWKRERKKGGVGGCAEYGKRWCKSNPLFTRPANRGWSPLRTHTRHWSHKPPFTSSMVSTLFLLHSSPMYAFIFISAFNILYFIPFI